MNKAAQSLGRLGGLVKSKAKAKASKANGKKGGRPKKHGLRPKEVTYIFRLNHKIEALEKETNALKFVVGSMIVLLQREFGTKNCENLLCELNK